MTANETTAQTAINENLIFELDPLEIKVKDDRPRQRKDLGDIAKMAESISKYGQLLPVLIDREGCLVAGGRRLAACVMLGKKVRVSYKDEINPMVLRELELEENIQRKSLTPAEEVLAVDELMKVKRQLYGESVSGKEGGFTQEQAAELLGKSRTSIIEDLQLAAAIKMFPDLSNCKTKSEIKKAVKSLERINEQVTALSSYEEKIKKSDKFVLVNRSAEDYLRGLSKESIDLFMTDPPYGIDIHNIAISAGGQTGGDITATNVKYDDSEDYAKKLLLTLVTESFRITKDTGHAIIFCAPSNFWWLSEEMKKAGWLVAPRPVIWIKRETGQNNQPEKWFSAAYEFILFARKPNSKLILQGKPDWIQCDPVLPSERTHQAEKPIVLCKELISRCCMPGQYLLDACMGSGAIVQAGIEMKMLCLGCEKSLETYAGAVARISKMKVE
jgi:ParB/RepB/Spo0J family partition protein